MGVVEVCGLVFVAFGFCLAFASCDVDVVFLWVIFGSVGNKKQ
jgi:hypothetical protein